MEFYDVGKRCSLPECQQHVPTCPACAAPVTIAPDEVADDAVNRHLEQDCEEMKARTAQAKKKKPKKRCEAAGCHLVLGAIRPSSTCAHCARVLCLAHRFPEQHQCRKDTRRERCATAAEQRRLNPTVFMLHAH
ncbi:hypothetical protein SYNPS1DRAFT_26899 [Syncephalis pseudoplumigaleata]|uniref:AN1-type domain-containing protein n=1 Tax=Syncephalis pseudoplumigaleata TaxID=1712513 RepID=A0A4P9Z4E3_9FUNG|nr:hypothetical protein SYNPS1DRAFT_26899 [Syncephalis pseudoplumigaleata]|eukprot:RKP27444.1 hypothetical protein SYNPS1DRAFT_26899 [Syncephalis pseudoplumigaleata]